MRVNILKIVENIKKILEQTEKNSTINIGYSIMRNKADVFEGFLKPPFLRGLTTPREDFGNLLGRSDFFD